MLLMLIPLFLLKYQVPFIQYNPNLNNSNKRKIIIIIIILKETQVM